MVRLQIFDVQHGACAHLTSDNDRHMLIDCGQNSDSGWKPGTHLYERGILAIDQLPITNYDEDHARGAPNLFDLIKVRSILRNPSVSPDIIKTLKSEDGMGPGIERLVEEIKRYNGPIAPGGPGLAFQGVEVRAFCCPYPRFTDENNLSLVVFLKCHGVGVMFPGDIEKNGAFPELLKREDFRQALRETDVYVAPHHGRENGCSEEALAYLTNVTFCVISDKGHMHDTQKTLNYYRSIARGGPFRGEPRYVLTTRKDGTITFEFNYTSWRVW